LRVNPHPRCHPNTLGDEEIWRTYEASNRMKRAMMKQEFFLILFFDSKDRLDVAGGGADELPDFLSRGTLVCCLFGCAPGRFARRFHLRLAGFFGLGAGLAFVAQFFELLISEMFNAHERISRGAHSD
jgi:hypothetical protein